jgi:peptidoglycan/xylan/chitin deacetylase (PgdA/CDA1 family)
VELAVEQQCGFVHLDQPLVRIPPAGKPFVALTFDDGHDSDALVALPILQEFAIPATFFITVGFVGQPGYMRWEQVRTLADAGMAIGSHTLTHPCLPMLSPPELRKELVISRQALEDSIGAPVKLLSVPAGFYNRRVIEAAGAAGYTAVCTSDYGIDRLPDTCRGGPTVFKRNCVDLRTSSGSIRGLLQARILLRILVRERAKRFLARLAPSWYQRSASLWRRRIAVSGE